jgi:ABC-2 type transport system ATP-binding protein
MMHAIELRDVRKTFGANVAVDRLSLAVPRGAVCGVIGPSGAGKTTCIRMIMSILFPDSGSLSVLDRGSALEAKDQIGYLPEERGVYRKMRVGAFLTYLAQLKGVSRETAAARIPALLEQVGLRGTERTACDELSKGMLQRVQFVGAILHEPELLILDEPFSGLDPVNAEVLREAILELRQQGSTVIFSTHDMAVAERMCDAIFMIYKGKKVLDGTLDSIQAKYGQDTIRVRIDGNGFDALRIKGVQRFNDFGRFQELRIAPGTDSQDVLADLMNRGRVLHFEQTQPSLHDIFVRIAGPQGDEHIGPAHAH